MAANDKAGIGAADEVSAQIKLQNIFEQQMTPPPVEEKEPVTDAEIEQGSKEESKGQGEESGLLEPAADDSEEHEETAEETDEETEENLEFTGVDPESEAEPETEPPAPTIAPPVGMRDDEAAEFAKLSPDLQKFLVQQEANRSTDYQRKTTEIAEQRKETEALKSQYVETLEQQKVALEQFVSNQGTIEAPNVELSVSDPDQYIRELAVYNANKEQQDKALDEHEKIQQEQNRLYQEQQKTFVDEQAGKLIKLVPELVDKEKGKALANAIGAYAKEHVGLSDAQLTSLTANEIHTIYKAYKLDNASKVTKKAKPKSLNKPPKAARAKATSSVATKSVRQRNEIKKRLNKTKDLKDLATLYMDEV